MEYVQSDIFSELYPKFTITKPIRLIELFAGIGSQAKALKNLGANFEHWRAVEVDKYAIASYNAVHGTHFETSDITQIHAADLEITERDKYCYLMTYSFPCQDLSVAGHMKGMKKGSGTRSGLLWEVERILDECGENLPQVLLMENVPAVISQKNVEDFHEWQNKLESLGYQSYAEILNAKDYGIPQNRARCFMVSILGEYSYQFPSDKDHDCTLADYLDPVDEIDEKYYISESMLKWFRANSEKQKSLGHGFRFEPLERERESGEDNLDQDGQNGKRMDYREVIQVGYVERGTGRHQSNEVYDPNGLARTLQAGDWKSPLKIICDE